MSKNKELLKKDDVVQAVLIADVFSDEFELFTKNTPFVLLPLVNKPILDYTLEFLASGGVEETFIFCCSHADAIKEYISNAKKTAIWANVMDVHILISESCTSLGDCLRDIYAKGVIRGNFVLVEPGVISNMKLLPILQEHIATLKKDKGATMTLVMQATGSDQNGLCPKEETLIVTNDAKQVLLHRRLAHYESSKIKLPLEMFLDHVEVKIWYNPRDTHISICGPNVLPLFADNFDYQTRWDFIRGIMMVDEVDDSTIYCHLASNGQMGAAITSWDMFQSISWEVVAGWFYPISYKIQTPIMFGKSVVKGDKCIVSPSATLVNCILGDNVKIGDKACLKNTILFPNVRVDSECEVVNCIIGEDSIISSKSKLKNKIYCDRSEIERKPLPKICTELFDGFETSDSEDESYTTSPAPDDTKMFFSEVMDSLERGIEDKLQCHNLILEINSSRYAYNVSLKEVNYFVSKAILSLPFQLQDGSQYLPALSRCLAYFSPILKNYIRDDESMNDCLQALQDVAIANNELSSCIVKVLNWLYDKDFLSEEVISSWFKSLDRSVAIYSKVVPFVKWLQEAEEETSDEEEE